jgi:hypothetical protein
MDSGFDWWLFHTVGDGECDACAVSPTRCDDEDCPGLVHTHFDGELDAVEASCDACKQVDVPVPAEVE